MLLLFLLLSSYANAESFTGALDEVALWSRPLAAAEVAALVASGVPLRPADGASFTSVLLERPQALGKARAVQAVQVDWSTLPTSGGPEQVQVQLSTDRGATWCTVTRGSAFTDELHGGPPGACFFPTVTLKLRVSWLGDATLTSLSVTALTLAPQLRPRPPVPLGLNMDGPSYYSRLLPFADAWQMGAASDWPFVRSGVDVNGWPREIHPELDDVGGYWVVGRTMMLTGTGATYPPGTYTIIVNGTGVVQLTGDGGNAVLRPSTAASTSPMRYLYNITKPTDVGIYAFVSSSDRADPIRRVHVFLPGHAPPALPAVPRLTPAGAIPPASFFNAAFLARLRAAGVKRLRFMDWGATNGNNVANWADRTTPSSVSQVLKRIRRIPIARVACLPTPSSAFVLEPLRVTVVTATPHGLVTGNMVTLGGTNGAMVTRGSAPASVGLDTPPGMEPMVHVINATSFVVSLASWGTPSDEAVTSCTPSTAGYVQLSQRPGVSYEVMISLANALGADAWVSVPHLASDAYVTRMAQLFRDTLKGTLYLEYSNEVWNWIFSQTHYASRMAALAGSTQGDRHLTWMAKRSVQVFNVFDSVYNVSEARRRVVRVIAVQQGSGQPQLQQAAAMVPPGHPVPVDALAIAPYFGPSNTRVYPQRATITVDELLDLARDDIAVNRRDTVRAAVQLTKQYGIRLLAYEGGQHMGGGGGECGGDACENVPDMQAKFVAANRDWRMAGLYDSYLRMWGAEAGPGAAFMAFSYTAAYSKWGSWGALEYLNSTDVNSPKWAAMLPFFRGLS